MHSLFRVGKKSAKFDFEISGVHAEHSSIEGKLVTLRWSRGRKGGFASKNVVATPDGRAIWAAAGTLELSVTLFRSDLAGAFDAKDFKISVDEVVRAGSTKTLASARIDLARFADKAGAKKRTECELALVSDEGLKGRIKLTVASGLEGALVPVSRGEVARGEPPSPAPAKAESLSTDQPVGAALGERGALEKRRPAPSDTAKEARATREGHKTSKVAAWERRALGLQTDRCEATQQKYRNTPRAVESIVHACALPY